MCQIASSKLTGGVIPGLTDCAGIALRYDSRGGGSRSTSSVRFGGGPKLVSTREEN